MLFDQAFVGQSPQDALSFIVEILQSSTEYSLIGKGLDGRILLWNEGARRLYGYEPAEVLGKASSDLLHTPEDVAAGLPAAMMAEAQRTGKWEGLITRVRKNGERFAAQAVMTPHIDGSGNHVGYLLISRDVTERVETEKALAERVRHGLLIGEVGAALTRSKTLEEMLELCTQALVRHLDCALARIWMYHEAEGTLDLRASAGLDNKLDGPDLRVPFGQFMVERIAQEGRPHRTNQLRTDPDTRDQEWVRQENLTAFAGYPLEVENHLLGVVAVYAREPLTAAAAAAIGTVADELSLGIEHFRATETLRERQEHIRLLLDSTAEAIVGMGIDGTCTFANAACARLLGYEHPRHWPGGICTR